MRLAYLTTEYPKVSHTFIRREIRELDRRGHSVLRLAIRDSEGAIADPEDREEAERTFHLLSASKPQILGATAWAQATRPERWIRAAKLAAEMGVKSDRGLVRHGAYLAEGAFLARKLIDEEVEHLHVHFGTNATAVARIARVLGGPQYSFTVHGPDELDQAIGFSLGAKITDAAFVVAISDYCGAQLRRWVPYEQWGKIHQVRCSVGEQFFAEATPIDPTSKTLLSIGRLSAQKGQLLLVDAVARLAREGLDFRLVLAGDGEMRAVIEARVAEENLGDRVTITGWIDEAEIKRRIKACRALVLPSFAEGLPVVIMEALAMTRPVLSTYIAGIPELVRPGENGWLVPAGNVDLLAGAIRAVLAAPMSELEALGRAGQRRVRERHLTSTEVDRLEALYLRYAPAAARA
ncbi:MAG: glycosyltransferase [Deltaproteobacteria bacterium]|nr:glycosyltransferase [Deltaproteobacteria bacterium]